MKTKHHEVKRHHEEKADTAAETPTADADRKPATEPWAPEQAADSPRKRGILGIGKSKKGYELRWVRLDAVDRRKNQGYVLATPEDFDATPDENGMIRRNELVLMVIPTEEYRARRAQVGQLTAEQSRAPKREYLREREVASRQSGHNLSDETRDEE